MIKPEQAKDSLYVGQHIGNAYMDEKGTIELRLRVREQRFIGHTVLSYPKDDLEYENILAHLGDLKPGEHKPVPPWMEC